MIASALALICAIAASAYPPYRTLFTALAVVLILLGAFQIFEGVKGWCVLRAMGIRTRL